MVIIKGFHRSFKSTETKLVHRLDKETSGVLIVALNRNIANYISLLFREKKIIKTYWSLNTGKFKKGKGVINKKIKSKLSDVCLPRLIIDRFQINTQ